MRNRLLVTLQLALSFANTQMKIFPSETNEKIQQDALRNWMLEDLSELLRSE